ncbi:CDK5RAP1-like protein [Copidosoma floridanum]|uniref:CDK5RAP1-like protein n=1 Tax=Copidosoma floridanum TaxID=29053 RepID=UPI0006C9D94E|nr:CDK5RAP1-like protein [Copidosoma floridanum]
MSMSLVFARNKNCIDVIVGVVDSDWADDDIDRRFTVYLEVYGCQMNVNDAEIISGILREHNYNLSNAIVDADIVLLVTCAIRDGAEQKVWNKLQILKSLKKKRFISKIGLLGCMAERLKHKIVEEEKMIDVIAGPDSYKDLPRLLALDSSHETAINVALSFDETYADVTPIRFNKNSKTAYV